MPQEADWWARQFIENTKKIALAYGQFCTSREINDFEKAHTLHEELNAAYEISLDLIEFVQFGREWLSKQQKVKQAALSHASL